jgi:hypothetical protein
MTTFTLDTDNNITAHDAAPAAQDNMAAFATEKELTKLAADWPVTRFVEVWNAFAGAPPFGDLKPVKKFTDRKAAVSRIWKAIQALTPTPAQPAAPVAPKKAKAAKQATAKDATPVAREGSKKAIVIDLLKRPEGATLNQIMEATAWQAHSVRGFISGSLTKKMGLKIESSKSKDGERVYRSA